MEDFGNSKASQNRTFTFNACIDEKADQEEFYNECEVGNLVQKALHGYSATLFAYGQTGSGKTYTVSGPEEVIVNDSYTGGHSTEGLVPRAARQLFQAVSQAVEGEYSIKAACFEIYNEQVLDLLNPESGQLQIRESKSQGFFVENLLVVDCSAVSELMEVFKEGTKNRHVASHTLNRDSSRSHGVLALYIDRTTIDPDSGEQITEYGKLTFVDLAGSERLKYSHSSGAIMKETGSINKSLFTLGKVIATLDKGEAFVPYRESKLTKLLMDSLGGSSSCVMVACCSPSSKWLEETYNTLQYANRAKNICNKPIVQLDSVQRLIRQLRHEITSLRAENAQLRMQQGLSLSDAVRPQSSILRSDYVLGKAGSVKGSPRTPSKTPLDGPRTQSELSHDAIRSPSQASQASHRRSSKASSSRNTPRLTGSDDEPNHTLPRYETAVGYAEGYAAGLEQAKEVLSNGGMDLAGSYDLTRSLNSRNSARLPPLSSRGGESGTTSRAHAEFDVPKEEYDNLRQSHALLEDKCTGLKQECLRLQGLLDNRAISGPTRSQHSHDDQSKIIQSAMFDRMKAENEELKRLLMEKGGPPSQVSVVQASSPRQQMGSPRRNSFANRKPASEYAGYPTPTPPSGYPSGYSQPTQPTGTMFFQNEQSIWDSVNVGNQGGQPTRGLTNKPSARDLMRA